MVGWGVRMPGFGSAIFFHCNLLHASEPNLSDRPRRAYTKVFPRFRSRPIPSLQRRKIGLVLSGGSGSCVAACGVAPFRSRSC